MMTFFHPFHQFMIIFTSAVFATPGQDWSKFAETSPNTSFHHFNQFTIFILYCFIIFISSWSFFNFGRAVSSKDFSKLAEASRNTFFHYFHRFMIILTLFHFGHVGHAKPKFVKCFIHVSVLLLGGPRDRRTIFSIYSKSSTKNQAEDGWGAHPLPNQKIWRAYGLNEGTLEWITTPIFKRIRSRAFWLVHQARICLTGGA